MNKRLFCVLVSLLCAFAAPAMAQICTSDPSFNINLGSSGTGVVTEVIAQLSFIVNGVAQLLFNSMVSNTEIVGAIRAAVAFYLAYYGYLLVIGSSQITVSDFTIRALKMTVVLTMTTPGIYLNPETGQYAIMGPWTFFSTYVVRTFDNGTNEIIAYMGQVAMGQGWAGSNSGATFAIFDELIAYITSPRLVATLFAILFSGPFGLIFALLLFMSLGQILAAVFQAMWIYLMSVAMRAFLFSVAPIFLCFLLFSRTRSLFDGWFNHLVSSCLQPIFLFTFFAFFAVLIYSVLLVFTVTPVCQVPIPGGCFGGLPNTCSIWRFAVNGVPSATLDFTDPFPVSFIDVIVLMLVLNLTIRIIPIVIGVSKDLAQAAVNLDMNGAVARALGPQEGMMDMLKKHQGDAVKKVVDNLRKAPPRRGA